MTDNSLRGSGDGNPSTAPAQFSPPVPLNLDNHCLFCLQPQQAQALLEVARRNPKLRKNPSPVIQYLTGTGPYYDLSEGECERMGQEVTITARFPPVTCAACYDTLVKLYRLHEKLLKVRRMIQKQTELARELIIKSQQGSSSSTVFSRLQFYSKLHSSGMPVEEIRAVTSFVDNFHSKIVLEAASKNHNVKLSTGVVPDLFSVDHVSAPAHSKDAVGDFEMLKDPERHVKCEYEKDDADKDGEDIFEEFNDFGESSNTRNADTEFSPSDCDLRSRDYVPFSPDGPDQSSSSSSTKPPPKKRSRKDQNDSVEPNLTRSAAPRTIIKISSQHCDICGELCRFPEIRNHLEENHHVQDFIKECPNGSCPYVFSCRGKLEKHLRSFPNCREFFNPFTSSTRKCEACNLDVYKTKFLIHLRNHELQMEDKILPCPIRGCPDRFAVRQSLEEHILTHDGRISKRSKEQECSVCKLLLKIGNVKKHLKEVHEVKEVISCRRCPFLFHDWESLLDHLGKHRSTKRSGGSRFTCDICNDGVKFVSYESLRHHFFNLHKIGKSFHCEFCGNELFSQKTLSLHKQKWHSSGQLPAVPTKATTPKHTYKLLVCDQCPDFRSHGKVALQTHKIKEHGAPPVTCKFCGDSFRSMASLVKHERAHLGLVHTYKCRVESCGKVFQKMPRWKDHELTAHNNNSTVKLVVCETCGKGFNSKNGLYSHRNQVHFKKKEPRRICEICGESFSAESSLRRHHLVHTGERPYQCLICSQAFRYRDVMNTHMKSHKKKGDNFKPNGPMKNIRKRVVKAAKNTSTQ